jgi:(hydroxyamino)benzene mutase
MSEPLQGLLAYTGVLLFFLGLLTGIVIPFARSPRIGLSAHVAAIQSGLTLIGVAWLGSHLVLADAWARAIAHTLWISFYVLWAGLLFGAVFGTGRALPLAGRGHIAQPWQERIATVLIAGSSIASALAIGALLVEWSWRAA